MGLYLFASMAVSDYPKSQAWYEKLFGGPPSFRPNDHEAVWDLEEGRSVYIDLRPEHAGHSHVTLFVDDLPATESAIAARGLVPAKRERYDNGVQKLYYVDPDGNEVGYGGRA